MLDAEVAEAIVGDERVVRDDGHPEADRPAGDLLPDPAEPEDAERLAFELHPTPARPLPPALLQRGMGLRDVARERDQEADRLLGGGDDGRLGSVGDDDAVPRRRVDVDVVDSDTGPADHLQPRRPLDQLRGELRGRADHDRVVAVDDLLERRGAVVVDVEPRAQELDSRVGDRLPHEHPRGHPAGS